MISLKYLQLIVPVINLFVTTDIKKSMSEYRTQNNWIKEAKEEYSDDFDHFYETYEKMLILFS